MFEGSALIRLARFIPALLPMVVLRLSRGQRTLSRTRPAPREAVQGLCRLVLLVLFGLVGAGLSPAYAAVTCFSDTDGPNDPPGDGQGDITRFCLDNANLPSSFDVYMNWDEASFNGANTGDGCVLFDTNGDAGGNVDFAICISVGGNPGSMVAGPLLYSCNIVGKL
jgi:hypothetical protein